MQPNIVFGLTLIAMILNAPIVQAQTAIQDLQRDRSPVQVAGVVHSIVGNEFILNDGTGQLIVDTGPPWYRSVNLSVGEKVSVVGEFNDYDFDAHHIIRSNGEVIVIRERFAPSAWMGRGQKVEE